MEHANAATANQNAPRQNELSVVLDEIEGRANKATPGPWEFVNRPDNQFVTAGHLYVCALAGIWAHDEDFTFIASSRTDVPKLVEAVRIAMDGLLGNYGPDQKDREQALKDIEKVLAKREAA